MLCGAIWWTLQNTVWLRKSAGSLLYYDFNVLTGVYRPGLLASGFAQASTHQEWPESDLAGITTAAAPPPGIGVDGRFRVTKWSCVLYHVVVLSMSWHFSMKIYVSFSRRLRHLPAFFVLIRASLHTWCRSTFMPLCVLAPMRGNQMFWIASNDTAGVDDYRWVKGSAGSSAWIDIVS